jgi:hypothetical protein
MYLSLELFIYLLLYLLINFFIYLFICILLYLPVFGTFDFVHRDDGWLLDRNALYLQNVSHIQSNFRIEQTKS